VCIDERFANVEQRIPTHQSLPIRNRATNWDSKDNGSCSNELADEYHRFHYYFCIAVDGAVLAFQQQGKSVGEVQELKLGRRREWV